jgi:nicotinamide-nucleotide adenylyltransferase
LNSENALYIGRFQPLPHIGHEQVLKELFEKHENVIIVLGSANKSDSPEHLLSPEERQEVLETLLRSLGIKKERYEIIPVPDIDCYPKYVSHLESFVPKLKVVYSGNPVVQELFKEKGYRVEELESYGDISGTKLRKLMMEGKDYEKYLPKACIPFLKKFDIVKRLKKVR